MNFTAYIQTHLKHLCLMFVLVYSASFLQPIFHCVEYVYNYEYISEVLCQNQSDEVLTCFGHCYLQQQLLDSYQHSTDLVSMLKYDMNNKSTSFVYEQLQLPTKELDKYPSLTNFLFILSESNFFEVPHPPPIFS